MEDREIKAIASVNDALKDLNEDERYRVIQWLASKYVQGTPPLQASTHKQAVGIIEAGDTEVTDGEDTPAFTTFAELLDACGSDKQNDHLLIAGYWLQVVQKGETWTTRLANNVLKPTGFGIDRVDNATNSLLSEKPRKLLQVAQKQSGKGHGHKQFKLTDIGINAVKDMFSGK